MLLLIVAMFFACTTSTEPDPDPIPDPVPPELPDGDRAMVIEVTDRNTEPLTGYNIDISGPTSASESNVSESSFRFEDLESGEYTILVTRDDFLDATLTLVVELPEERTEEYFIQDIASLAKKAPPVVISNSEESQVETESDDPEETEDERMVMSIPANTFPADVQDEDGNVQIRVTRAAPSQLTEAAGGGVVSDMIAMEPTGVTLNNPVQISIPINSTPGVQYVLQPGNIPLTPGSGSLMASNITANQRSVQFFTVDIEQFQNYTIEADVQVNRVRGNASVTLDPSACGTNHTFQYSTPIIIAEDGSNDIPDQARKTLKTYQRVYGGGKELSVSSSQLTNDDSNFRFTASVVTNFLEYEVISGDVTETFIRNTSATMTSRSAECHNSGGG